MRCEIDDARMFLQVVNERRDVLEVLREALSNSYDAGASLATVVVRTRTLRAADIEIHDNGVGIRPSEFKYFFGLGFGNKEGRQTIGSKGLGTKLFFNSQTVQVTTRLASGRAYEASLESPKDTLERGAIPYYSLRSLPTVTMPYRHGTSIRISGLETSTRSSLLTVESIVNYLRWYTVAGACDRILGIRRRRPFRVKLVREGRERRECSIDGHELPGLRRPIDSDYESFALMFKPFSFQLSDEDGEQLGHLEIVGSIVGPEGHMVTDRRIKKRFKGVFLAKDYFIVRNVSEEVFGGTGEWQSVHIVANCQELQLSMNRDDFIDSGHASVYNEAISALRSFANALKRGRRFRYRGRTVETGRMFAGACYKKLRSLRELDLHSSERNLKALDIVAISEGSSLALGNDGGPMYEPLNAVGVMLVFQALVSKGYAFHLISRSTGATKFRVLGYSRTLGGHILLQKRKQRSWSRPLFFRPALHLSDIKDPDLLHTDGIVCWDRGAASSDRVPSLDVIVVRENVRWIP